MHGTGRWLVLQRLLQLQPQLKRRKRRLELKAELQKRPQLRRRQVLTHPLRQPDVGLQVVTCGVCCVNRASSTHRSFLITRGRQDKGQVYGHGGRTGLAEIHLSLLLDLWRAWELPWQQYLRGILTPSACVGGCRYLV